MGFSATVERKEKGGERGEEETITGLLVGGMEGLTVSVFVRLGIGITSSSSSLSKSITSTTLLGFCGEGVTGGGALLTERTTTGEAI